MLWGYFTALLASHLVRWMHPYDSAPRPDERAISLRAVAHSRELPRPIRLAWIDHSADSADAARLPVLLVHGSPGDNGEVAALAERLSARHWTLAPDLPGFGGSSRDVPDYSVAAHARYLLQLLDSLHIAQVHLVGFSMGGGVVLQLEQLAPARVGSITMLSAIGAQEYELLGDYHLNHGIHGLQLAGLWLLREAVPHFGWLDDAVLSVAYARNFFDTDQRPLRGILERYAGPMLILQGEHDPLVAPAVAREHARLVPQAELQMDQGNHFSAFTRPDTVAAAITVFLDRVEAGTATVRATATPDRLARAAEPFDPSTIPKIEGVALVIVMLLLALATLVSEDLTCIATGLMIARGTLGFFPGTIACFVGIFGGDMLVFLAGRSFGRAVLQRPPVRWFLSPDAVTWGSQWVTRKGAALVFVTRLLPGTRLPTYFAAGMLRTSFRKFALYFFAACLVWTPILVGISAAFGEVVQRILGAFTRHATLYLSITGLVLFLLLKLFIPLTTWRGRRLLLSRWRRLSRWEFWPRWLFYPPVVLYILWLGLKHRSLTLFTAVNPAIPGGGFVGESKAQILAGLSGSPDRVAPWELLPAALAPVERLGRALAFRARHAPEWPLVLKPDIGERGSGVSLCRSEAEVERYLVRSAGDTIVQAYAPGAEFGVFYLRRPGAARGEIFSITDKRFLSLTGDGTGTLEELILADDRAVCMAPFHLRQHASRLGWIPAAGETVPLVELGTHCLGATFMDGGWVRTPALEAAIDQLSQGFRGFWFGRYDIRTTDVAAFQAGRDFMVVELNGATAEATSIYDPGNTLGSAYRTLRQQWRLCFEIAAANVARGAVPTPFRELWRLVRRHRDAIRAH